MKLTLPLSSHCTRSVAPTARCTHAAVLMMHYLGRRGEKQAPLTITLEGCFRGQSKVSTANSVARAELLGSAAAQLWRV